MDEYKRDVWISPYMKNVELHFEIDGETLVYQFTPKVAKDIAADLIRFADDIEKFGPHA
jgi:hypothetical protein